MTPVRSPTPVNVDMKSINLTPDEEMLFLAWGRPFQTGSPLDLMSLSDRPGLNQTVPSPLTAPQTITAPASVPEVLLQPAVEQPTQPLPVTITPSSGMQPYFTGTPQQAAGQPTSQSTQPLPVTSTPSSVMQPYFTGTPQLAAVQPTTQSTRPLPVTIIQSSLVQPYLTETVTLQPTAGQPTTQSAQPVTVPINPSPKEKNDIPTYDHSSPSLRSTI
ncbi:unnamed protein product [Mytilus coruscus]|uniref:Uncharacterized protein n=1 Tax=Mytilus coruscus TaxID=42192 RepID=A0A6J8BEE2_MYTCO|nr:unnamed protein product [Mytilus coruscus]